MHPSRTLWRYTSPSEGEDPSRYTWGSEQLQLNAKNLWFQSDENENENDDQDDGNDEEDAMETTIQMRIWRKVWDYNELRKICLNEYSLGIYRSLKGSWPLSSSICFAEWNLKEIGTKRRRKNIRRHSFWRHTYSQIHISPDFNSMNGEFIHSIFIHPFNMNLVLNVALNSHFNRMNM